MERRHWHILTVAGAVAAAVLMVSRLFGVPGTNQRDTVYETQAVSKGLIRKIVSTSGPVRALVTVSVGSQLSGQIETVNVDFNSAVRSGDLLAMLDAKTFAARVAQAKADLAVAKAALANQQAALVKAESVQKLAERNVERQRTLSAKGFASTAALDGATRDIEVAMADITVAKAQIESAKASIEQREAQLKQSQIDLERTEIRAPVDGTVISRTVDPGQTVAASLQAPELFKIAQDLSRIRIEAQVNEADVGAVTEGNPAAFTVDAYPDRRFEGRVTQVRLAATEINNVVTYTVIIEAANEDRRLFPGMTANVEIEAAKKDGVLRVTNDAFRFRPRASATGEAAAAGPGERSQRLIERLATELQLTDAQRTAASEAVSTMMKELRASTPAGMSTPSGDPAVFRQRVSGALEQALGPLLSDEQRRLFEKWKQGREVARTASVWVPAAGGAPERRAVRTGIGDEQWTEIAGGDLKEGDLVIVRAREVQK